MLHTDAYNGARQTIRGTDGEGQETLYTYNGLGQLTRKQTSARTEGEMTFYRITAYRCDSVGNKIEEACGQQKTERDKDPDSWHRIHYDPSGYVKLKRHRYNLKQLLLLQRI